MEKEHIVIVATSDTHNKNIDLPKGDIYIHCGDFTNTGSVKEVK